VGVIPDVQMALTQAENEALRAWRASYSPPDEALAAIAEWERTEGRKLAPAPPPDAHLDAALELLRGRRPGTYAEQSRP
jgi:hypothetical protein